MMSGIRGKNTGPELVVRRALFAAGYRFRLHRRDLPGTPDIVLPGRKGVSIFVHGCFWHRHPACRYATLPSTRSDFWRAKLEGNAERDRRNIMALIADGWRVMVVWECATRALATWGNLSDSLIRWIEGDEQTGEVSIAASE